MDISHVFDNNLGMSLLLAVLVGSLVAAAGVQIWLCIRCRSLLLRLIPVFVCLGLTLLSIFISGALTFCSILLLLFTGVGWVVARMIFRNSR